MGMAYLETSPHEIKRENTRFVRILSTIVFESLIYVIPLFFYVSFLFQNLVMERDCTEESIKQKKKNVNNNDLQEFLKSFDDWQDLTECLMKEKSKLVQEVRSLSNDKQKLVSRNEELQNQISHLQTVLDSTHKGLHRICDIEEENRKIKAKSESFKTEIVNLNGIINDKEKEHLREIEQNRKEHDKQKDGVKNSLKIVLDEARENHISEINQKNIEIDNLREKLVIAGRENETEIARVSIEYENKLAKLRKKIPSSVTQASSSNQEIFRMKLQHMKNEYEREVRLLKEKVQELEVKVNVQGGNRVTFSANKKRKF